MCGGQWEQGGSKPRCMLVKPVGPLLCQLRPLLCQLRLEQRQLVCHLLVVSPLLCQQRLGLLQLAFQGLLVCLFLRQLVCQLLVGSLLLSRLARALCQLLCNRCTGRLQLGLRRAASANGQALLALLHR